MGISFTIPINYASEIVDQLKTEGIVSRGWLGVSVQEVTKDLADSFKLGTPRGALIGSVLKGSPAEKSGLKNGDVILSFNGQNIVYSGDLPLIVGRIKPETSVNAVIFRSGIEKKIRVKVGVLEEATKNKVIPGKAKSKITLIKSLAKKGKTPLNVSFIGISPAILLIIKAFNPTGGVINPTSTTIKVKIPNQIAVSSIDIPKSSWIITGKKTGIVNKIIAKLSIRQPRKI